jgi:hypothetical protein
MRPEDYRQIPENRHGLGAGSILLATETPITVGGGTSKDFVEQQGGDDTTFVFVLGVREAHGPLGHEVEFIEGVFLSEGGPGFHPTWDHEQLLREIDLGGWRVVTTQEMLASWVRRVEERMNRGEA